MYPTNNVPTVVPVQPPHPHYEQATAVKPELAPPVTSLLVTESVLPPSAANGSALGVIGGE